MGNEDTLLVMGQDITEVAECLRNLAIELVEDEDFGLPERWRECVDITSLEAALSKDPELAKQVVTVPTDFTPLIMTLLTLAVLRGDVSSAELLLEHGADANVRDSVGYTLAHWAAMHPHIPMLKLLKEYGAELNGATLSGTRPMDLLRVRLSNPQETMPHALPVLKEGAALSLQDYDEIFGSPFLPYPRFTARALLALRRRYPVSGQYYRQHPIRAYVEEQFQHWKSIFTSPPFYVQKMHYKDDGSPVPKFLDGQWEGLASRKIAAGELVVPYSGVVDDAVWVSKYGDPSDRVMHVKDFPANLCIDAVTGDGMAQFINHGPPTLGLMTVMDHGLPIVVLFALRDIEKDEMLTYSYDNSGTWFTSQKMKMVELSPNVLRAFVQQTEGLTKLTTRVDQKTSSLQELLHACWTRHMLRYLTQADRWKPLVEEGLITREALKGARNSIGAS